MKGLQRTRWNTHYGMPHESLRRRPGTTSVAVTGRATLGVAPTADPLRLTPALPPEQPAETLLQSPDLAAARLSAQMLADL